VEFALDALDAFTAIHEGKSAKGYSGCAGLIIDSRSVHSCDSNAGSILSSHPETLKPLVGYVAQARSLSVIADQHHWIFRSYMVAGTPPSPVAGILAVLYAKIQNISKSFTRKDPRKCG